ncbi:MAG: hypothetical protein V3T17_08940 [Pseudomonadales bacterium]
MLTALGDTYFAKGEFKSGEQALLSALHCPNMFGNPIIHLRLGQCQFELGDIHTAKKQFQQVLQQGGKVLFEKEKNQYFDLLQEPTNP